VEVVVTQPVVREFVDVGCMNQPAERSDLSEASVIEEKDDDIGRAFRRTLFRCPPFFGFFVALGDLALEFEVSFVVRRLRCLVVGFS
jgi:hypothetical protein